MSDYFAFAENTGLTGVTIEKALEYTNWVADDDSYPVWYNFANGIGYARSILKFTSNKQVLDDLLQKLVSSFYKSNGWKQNLSTIRFFKN